MSENVITEENQNSAPAKKKRSKEDILEIVIAVFLGITALATAWASWIGSLHGGNMSTNYTKSNNLAADGNARWNEASQALMQDMQIWNMISDYEVEILYANETGDTDQMYESAYKIQFICTDNLTDEMADVACHAKRKKMTCKMQKKHPKATILQFFRMLFFNIQFLELLFRTTNILRNVFNQIGNLAVQIMANSFEMAEFNSLSGFVV